MPEAGTVPPKTENTGQDQVTRSQVLSQNHLVTVGKQ